MEENSLYLLIIPCFNSSTYITFFHVYKKYEIESRYYSRLLSFEDLTLEVLAISNHSKILGLSISLKHSREADAPLEAEVMEQMMNQ